MWMDESTGLLPRVGGDRRAKRRALWGALVALLVLLTIALRIGGAHWRRVATGKRNVIFFVTDGMGPASLAMTRAYAEVLQDAGLGGALHLPDFQVGSSRTRSSSSLITDSAAGATAFSCAMKTYNNAVGVDPDGVPCGTILEAAKLQGYLTGMVVTTRITDATPAAFSSHVDFRWYEDLIAEHQLGSYPLGRVVDLMIGGGRTHFYGPQDKKYGNGGSRKDGRNLIEKAVEDGWQYVGDMEEFERLQGGHNVSLPLLALLADYDIPFDMDRDASVHPSLEQEMTTAINALTHATKDSDKGFFLLVEGSRIDHAAHYNDPAAQPKEVLAFDRAFQAAVKFAAESDVETVLISTSDHETGGLAVGRQTGKAYPDYVWYPEVLRNATHSAEFLAHAMINVPAHERQDYVREKVLEKGLGIDYYSEEDVEELSSSRTAGEILDKLARMVSLRAEIGWSTHGHTGVDVNIYAFANTASAWNSVHDALLGNHENVEIGDFMARYLNLDLSQVTDLIKDTKHSP
ncbi:AaceriAGL260Wp [[Ashbya] aceris (nom. inval.)]|nr:AaceriAGL260Wp [[Ashbya] aceris (nom. inval.)]